MIARLRELADRPIADGERRRLFAAVALLIVLAAILLSVTGETGTERAAEQPPAAPAVGQPIPSPPADQDELEDGDRSGVAAERAARRFLDGYLAYLYGRGDARGIEAASAALAVRLRREQPRVSPATRRREPSVVDVSARRLDAVRYQVAATVADGGVVEYPIELTVARHDGDWVVTSTVVD